ncbi:MAG: DNA polymerase III subunit delta' [Myxococcota bacterium]|nr:DNA polymerase III subunit delta' [Myxococcota bacterium]
MSDWKLILGHSRAVAALKRVAEQERPNHAYLFLGGEGVGKATLAQTFARALACTASPESRPCGACSDCCKTIAGSHPDLWTESPGGKSNTITSDQITELQRRLSYRKSEARHRVIVIDGAGAMNTQAQNKLLKTLEEPPPETTIILCALHPSQMLATVRSRCQKVTLGNIQTVDLANWLVQKHAVSMKTAELAAAAARGRPGRAIELLDEDTALERSTQLTRLGAAMAGDRDSIEELLQTVNRDRDPKACREACREVLNTLQELLRDAMAEAAGSEVSAIHPGLKPRQGRMLSLGPRQLAERVGRIEASRERLHRNVDPVGLLEDLLVHLAVEAPRP